MRFESSVISISWFPSEAIPGIMRLPFDVGPFHYDQPPSDTLTDLNAPLVSGAIQVAVTDFKTWSGDISGESTPWGSEDSPAFVTEVESAVERELSDGSCGAAPGPTFASSRQAKTWWSRRHLVKSCSCSSTAY